MKTSSNESGARNTRADDVRTDEINPRSLARRRFISGAAAALSIAIAKRISHAQQNSARAFGLGFSLYGAKSLDLSTALQAVSRIGYDCIELPVMPDWPAESARLSTDARKKLADEIVERGLRLTALMENISVAGSATQHQTHLERLQRAAKLARDLSPAEATRPLIETIVGGKPGEFHQVKALFSERLRDYAKVAADAEVVLAIKAHVGNAAQQPGQIVELLDSVASPWLKAAYDFSHFEAQGLDMQATTDKLLPHSAFIHVKDSEQVQGKRNFLLPGEGSTDYTALFKLVHESRYRGDVLVEVSSQVFNRPGYEPIAAMQKCYNHLAKAFAEAGLPRG